MDKDLDPLWETTYSVTSQFVNRVPFLVYLDLGYKKDKVLVLNNELNMNRDPA